VGELGFLAGRQVESEQLVVADEGHLGAVASELGVNLGLGLSVIRSSGPSRRWSRGRPERGMMLTSAPRRGSPGNAGLAEPLPLAAELLGRERFRLGVAAPGGRALT